MLGFVVGNGKSRLGFDLKSLSSSGLIYGCNALYRDFEPDVLFSRDAPMIKEITENYSGVLAKWLKPHMIYGDEKIQVPSNIVLAGSVALWCMATQFRNSLDIDNHVYLLGFDPWSNDGRKNNVYTGTLNYGGKEEPAHPRVRQCITDLYNVSSEFNDTINFVLVCDDDDFVNRSEVGDIVGMDMMSHTEFKRLLSSNFRGIKCHKDYAYVETN
jgi:hypothetical protein